MIRSKIKRGTHKAACDIGGFRSKLAQIMRDLHRTAALGIALAAAWLAGCASEKSQEAALARMGDEAPPDFLIGPASTALTNFDGFSAKVVSTTSAGAGGPRGFRRTDRAPGPAHLPTPHHRQYQEGEDRPGRHVFYLGRRQPARLCGERGAAGVRPDCPACPDHPRDAGKQGSLRPRRSTAMPAIAVEKMLALSDGSTAKLTEWRPTI